MIKIDGQDHVNLFLYFQIPEPIGSSSNSSVHEPYIKPANHTTVTYPFSGICKPDPAKKNTNAHKAATKKFKEQPEKLLETNIKTWLTQDIVKNGDIKLNNVQWQFSECLSATEYNRFSNASSSNLDKNIFEFLEQPHNDIHLAVGGFTNPELNEDSSVGVDKDGKYEYYGLLEVAN